jgi:two-component system cell cycle response regulator
MLERLHGGKNLATPVIMLTGNGSESVAVEAMKRGACDYLRKENLGPESLFRVICNAVEKSALRKKLEEAQQKLETLALYDTLTGLGNRNLFQIELARAIAVAQRKNTSFMVLMMDLDNFKMANDTFGHEAGDAILAEIGCRLRNARAGDACFRLGGDEFTAILEAGSDGAAMARRIRTAVARPVLFGSHSLTVGISIGSAAYPADGSDADDLVRAADNAMYDDKNSGRPSAPGAAVAAA